MKIAMNTGGFSTLAFPAAASCNFTDYDVVRSDNYPVNVVTHVIPHGFDDHPTGVGEPGVPPVPPAIANGLFHATGQRKRAMPFTLEA